MGLFLRRYHRCQLGNHRQFGRSCEKVQDDQRQVHQYGKFSGQLDRKYRIWNQLQLSYSMPNGGGKAYLYLASS